MNDEQVAKIVDAIQGITAVLFFGGAAGLILLFAIAINSC